MKNFFLLLIFAISPILAYAQDDSEAETTTEEELERQFWRATVPGGTYTVALDTITAVSSHAYILDGAAVITEVNIDTTGNSLVRFYTITPIAAYENADIKNLLEESVESLREVTSSLGEGKSLSLTHKTNQTTHAKTIEYQISSLEGLKRILNSAQSSFLNNQGRNITLKK